MLQKADGCEQATMAPQRVPPLDRARTLITLLVLLHHAAVNYTYFGNGDRMRWLGFDLVVLFNDSFFMAFMFFISGLFVPNSLARRGSAAFLRGRAWRLGVPFLLSIFVLMPIAYYPTFLRYHLPGTTDFSFLHFWWRTITVGPWPSGPAWFLWVLLALDAVAGAAWLAMPRTCATLGQFVFALRNRPVAAFAAFLVFSTVIYLPLRLMFGDASWLEPWGYPLPIQTSRILLYAGYFFAGIGVGAVGLHAGLLSENGELARRWLLWLGWALLFFAAILFLIYVKRHWIDLDMPPPVFQISYGLAFAMFSATMVFAVLAILLRFAKSGWGLLDALQPSAYGIFLLHYIFIIWLQYAVYDHAWPAFAKFAIVFAGTLSMSWALTLALRRIPVVARMI